MNGRTRNKTVALETGEFTRRFLLHVLPGGFHRIRHYGLLANPSRRANLAKMRELLGAASATTNFLDPFRTPVSLRRRDSTMSIAVPSKVWQACVLLQRACLLARACSALVEAHRHVAMQYNLHSKSVTEGNEKEGDCISHRLSAPIGWRPRPKSVRLKRFSTQSHCSS